MARVMTCDEVLKNKQGHDYAWLEIIGENWLYHLQLFSTSGSFDNVATDMVFNVPFDTFDCKFSEYGRTWRIWTARPSDSKRVSTKWER